MLNYANLNDTEFEALCKDIMERMLGVSLRRFGPGRDHGVDLTDDAAKKNIVVQIKHYQNSTTDQLVRALKKELPKVRDLAPEKYYICCSRKLSVENVKVLYEHFSAYMDSDRHIITLIEIDDFLKQDANKDIRKKHTKYRMDDARILEEIHTEIGELRDTIQERSINCKPQKYILPSNLSSPDHWIPHSRDREISLLAESINNGETVFLHGVGGIGKTECAIKLAIQLNPPRGAYLVHFQNSMKDTILKMKFSGYEFKPKHEGLSLEALEEAEYQDRLAILQMYYRDAILIVDNFDVENQTLNDLRREPAFRDYLGLDLKRIFTTRYPVGRQDWEIKELPETALLDLMRQCCPNSNITDMQYLSILKEIQYHTLTATLIAKTLYESGNTITPEKILEALRNSRLHQEKYPEVESDQNRSYEQKQIYEHLKALFEVTKLDDSAQRILSYASLFPVDGILNSFFVQLLDQDEEVKLKLLVKQGWIISFDRDLTDLEKWECTAFNRHPDRRLLRIHPLIREIICNEISQYRSYVLEFWKKLKNYYLSVRDSEYRWAEEFSDDGEVTNPNYPYIASCFMLASKMLPEFESALLCDAGQIYLDLADQRALACFQRAVTLEEKNTSNKHFLAECYALLGDAYGDYRQSFDKNKAVEYTKKAVELMETEDFELSVISNAYHRLAYDCHFAGDNESFVYWMEKCVAATLQCWEPHHPQVSSGYRCLVEAYGYLASHYQERIERKRYLEHKMANGGFSFAHLEEEYRSLLSEEEYLARITHAERRMSECTQLMSNTEYNNNYLNST